MLRLIFVFYILFTHISFVALSQCTPNPGLFTSPGIEPDTMPDGYANNYYDEVAHFMMPLDTQGFSYQNIQILSVVGLPIGMSWECDQFANGCNYVPANNQYGCLRLYGTPIQTGSFSAIVNVEATLSVGVYPSSMISPITILADTSTSAGFNTSTSYGCTPLTVTFTNNNSGLMYYEWDFGNGTISNVENPAPQIYDQAGNYIINYNAWSDTNHHYILNSIEITEIPPQSNYGTFLNDYDPDLYIILYDNTNTPIFQSNVVDDTQPPLTFTIPNTPLNNATYKVAVWDKDGGFFGLDADDSLGMVSFNGYGGGGTASSPFSGGGNTSISYTVNVLAPTVLASYTDTLNIYETPIKANIDTNGSVVYIDTSYYTMQWYMEGTPIAGANASYHSATQTGYYWLVGTNEFGCSINTDTVFVINCNYGFPPNINVNNDVLWTDSVNYDLQWYLNGQILPGDTNNILFADTTGYYVLVATDSNNCTSNSNPVYVEIETDTIIDTTYIKDSKLNPNDILLFPNPNKGLFKLQFSIPNASKTAIISIFDINGSLIRSKNLQGIRPGDIQSIHAEDLESGIYFIYIMLDNGQINKKFIKY